MSARPPEWERSTAPVDSGAVPEEHRRLVREAALRQGFENDPLAAAGATGVRTHSTPLRAGGLLRRKAAPTTVTALIAGPLLIVLGGADGEEPAVTLYRLGELELAEYASALIEDSGLEITGARIGASERSVQFLPLERDGEGARFREDLRAANEAAR
ncbi:MAG: hypothetical protein KDB58_03090 [Solirubrobacterales bacterium]|nr:hypothetical protein [Solirubrobacterales bacterium]MCB8970943.1 hypothetical protein [Thermoleophilales bacterium]MCO5326161.1 hypothetical protein [Solirubrobacterales bacterium]